MRTQVATVCLLVCAWPSVVGSQAPATNTNPLHRTYHEGEKLVYRMTAVNEDWHYSVEADGVVKNDGKFYEEFQWTGMESGGKPLQMAASAEDFRQRLTLDPGVNPRKREAEGDFHDRSPVSWARPSVSANPAIRFRFCTAWPAAPFRRLSIEARTMTRPVPPWGTGLS